MKLPGISALFACVFSLTACGNGWEEPYVDPSLERVDDVCSVIADVALRDLCRKQFDANSDGKLSMNEAAAVLAINSKGYQVGSLEGIRYFSRLSVLELYNGTFRVFNLEGKKDLKELYLNMCLELEALDLRGFNQLKSIMLLGCDGLTSLTFPEKVSSDIKITVYSEILEELRLPEGMEAIAENTVDFCPNLKKIILPATTRSIHSQAFFPGSSSWPGYYELTVLANEPPTIYDSWYRSPGHIYVPASSLDAYKSAWSRYSDIISAIK